MCIPDVVVFVMNYSRSIKRILIREHFVIQLIMKISEIKLRRFEAILTPLSSKITVVVVTTTVILLDNGVSHTQ